MPWSWPVSGTSQSQRSRRISGSASRACDAGWRSTTLTPAARKGSRESSAKSWSGCAGSCGWRGWRSRSTSARGPGWTGCRAGEEGQAGRPDPQIEPSRTRIPPARRRRRHSARRQVVPGRTDMPQSWSRRRWTPRQRSRCFAARFLLGSTPVQRPGRTSLAKSSRVRPWRSGPQAGAKIRCSAPASRNSAMREATASGVPASKYLSNVVKSCR